MASQEANSSMNHEESPTSEATRVCVVATRPATFERCQAGLYPVPASYDRASKPFTYLAFYRTAPISSITQYARVRNRIEQHRDDAGPMNEADWTATIDPVADTDSVVVFELDGLIELDEPVTNDLTGVRGARYCPIENLQKASTLSELTD